MSVDKFQYLLIAFAVLCAPCIIPAAIFYARHRNRTPEGRHFPLWLYVIALLVGAFAAFSAGTGLGIESACQKPAGNLCGLTGVFVAGPLSALFTVTIAAWLMTLFPLQMKRLVPVVLVVGLTAGGYHYRDLFFSGQMAQSLNSPLVYRLQSADVDALQRYAPMMEAQMRKLPILKDVCLDPETKKDQAVILTDPKKPTVGVLPTRSITFTIVPPSKLDDATRAISDVRVRLAIPDTFGSSFAKAASDGHCPPSSGRT